MNTEESSVQRGARLRGQPWLLIGLVIFSFLVRLLMAGRVGVLSEEAYYWNYAQRPSLGYFDHPPGVAWMIAVTTRLFGRNDVALRIGPVVCAAVASWFLFLLARSRWNNARAGWRAVLLFNALPIFLGIGFFAFPDAPLVASWAAAVYCGLRAVETGQGRFWLFWGVAVGAALLAKYYGGALLLGAAAFGLWRGPGRAVLRQRGVYLGLAVALLLFTPVIWWNSQHDWASFRFQSLERAAGASRVNILEFIGFQVVSVTPVLFVLLVVVAGVAVRSPDWRDRWLAWQFWPIFLTFALYSFKNQVHINWVAPAYLSLLPLAQDYFTRCPAPRPLAWARWRPALQWSVGIMAGMILYLLGYLGGLIPPTWMPGPIARPLAKRFDWTAFAQALDRVEEDVTRQRGRKPFRLATDKYYLASQMGYLARARDWQDIASRNLLDQAALSWGFWMKPEDFAGRDAVVVAPNRRGLADASLAPFFDHLGPVLPLLEPAEQRHGRQFYYRIGYEYRPSAAQ